MATKYVYFFGNGKSAVKVTLGKFMETVVSVTGGANGNALTPVARLAVTTNRSWADGNGNWVPDCDLLNPNANGECGAMSDRRFGTAIPSQSPDRDAFEGWGKRAYNWEFGANLIISVAWPKALRPRASTACSGAGESVC